MGRARLRRLDRRTLGLALALFFLALAIPTAILVQQAYSRLKWETFHQYQLLARDLARRIDGDASRLIAAEEARPFSDYAFLTGGAGAAERYARRSPLSDYPVRSPLPGLIGHFQVGPGGRLSTPLLPGPGTSPREHGIDSAGLRARTALRDRILTILSENRLVDGAPGRALAGGNGAEGAAARERPAAGRAETEEEPAADPPGAPAPLAGEPLASQSAFDRLNEAGSLRARQKKQETLTRFGRVEELKLDKRFEARSREPAAADRDGAALQTPGEPGAAVELRLDDKIGQTRGIDETAARVTAFEGGIDPLELSLLDSGHFVLFRKVWRDGRRYIQGALIERQPFLRGLTETAFRQAAVSRMSDLLVAWQGNVFEVLSGERRRYPSSAAELEGELLYQARLSSPLDGLELVFSVNGLPAGPGGVLVTWIAVVLALVLPGGFFLLYRLGVRQIELARQQQDFVSAVSHELKTPLTSIRMYAEMLREGWAPEPKRLGYYEYIHDEAERLSRLIANVLQLARMSRDELRVEPQRVTAGELVEAVRVKVSRQVEHAGFDLHVDCAAEAAQTVVEADPDAFVQILINLVDNALKFSSRAETRRVELGCRPGRGQVLFSVRDYGAGVPRDQMKKIFRLFYRPGDELTRETVGTGIGLALVHRLAQAMGGRVDLVNASPGAEFRLRLPAAPPDGRPGDGTLH